MLVIGPTRKPSALSGRQHGHHQRMLWNVHIYVIWLRSVIGISSPEICLLFMPKMLAMKPSGNYCVQSANSPRPYRKVDTHEDDSHYGEDYDCSALPHCLLGLLDGLPSLEYRRLEIEKVVQLYRTLISGCSRFLPFPGLTASICSLIDLHSLKCSLRFSSDPAAHQSGRQHQLATRQPY